MYTSEGGTFYFIESGALSIPQGYKTVDGDGNAIISAQFFTDYPEFFVKSGDAISSTAATTVSNRRPDNRRLRWLSWRTRPVKSKL